MSSNKEIDQETQRKAMSSLRQDYRKQRFRSNRRHRTPYWVPWAISAPLFAYLLVFTKIGVFSILLSIVLAIVVAKIASTVSAGRGGE